MAAPKKKAAEKKDPTITSETVEAPPSKRDPDAEHVPAHNDWSYEKLERPDGGIAQVQILPGDDA